MPRVQDGNEFKYGFGYKWQQCRRCNGSGNVPKRKGRAKCKQCRGKGTERIRLWI